MLSRLLRSAAAVSARPACISRRAISYSAPRFLEAKTAADEHKQQIVNELALSPRVQNVLDSICELNLVEVAELSKAIQVSS